MDAEVGRTCFVIMPISTPADVAERENDVRHFEHVLDHLFAPAVAEAGFRLLRPVIENGRLIQAEIIRNLQSADLVLCDASTLNANVFFELGIRVALDRPVALVRDQHTPIPFDNAMMGAHTYASDTRAWVVKEEIPKLAAFVSAAGDHERNAMWEYVGITRAAKEPVVGEDPTSARIDMILANVLELRAAAAAAERSPTPENGGRHPLLTDTELRIASLVAAGSTARAISQEVGLPATTVERHLRSIFGKWGVHDRSQLIRGLGETYPQIMRALNVEFDGGSNEPAVE